MAQLFKMITAITILKPALALESNFIQVKSLLSHEVSNIHNSEKLEKSNEDLQQNNLQQKDLSQLEKEFYQESRYIDQHD